MNKRIIPLIFLAVIFSVSAIAVQNAYAGCVECGDTFFEQGPDSPSAHTTITPTHGSFGNGAPILYWGEPFMITLDTVAWPLCQTSTVTSVTVGLGPFSDNIFGGEEEALAAGFEFEIFSIQQAFAGVGASQPMVDQGDGTWKANFPALNPLHGNAPLTYSWTCSDSMEDGSMEDGGIFMDPSGQVTNYCTGEPIVNAQVTINSDHDGNINTVAPFGSYIPPVNPLFTDVNGLYAWDVQPFFNYRVDVSATGFVSQMSAVLPVPPPQTGIDFALMPEDGCPAIGGEIIPIESTSLILAGFQSTTMWILPIAFAGAGIAAFKLRKYWN